MIGVEIKRARGQRSLRSVARELEICPSYLSDIENGHRFPPPPTIRRIAEVLQVEPDRWLWLWILNEMAYDDALTAAQYGVRQAS